jgi:hypothetical membrane protein
MSLKLSIVKLDKILLAIFLIVMSSIALVPPIWGYDEYASVITHLELNDQRFIDIYSNYFHPGVNNFFINIFLSIFVVPLRWTYALGISPLYGIIRFIDLDWFYLRLIFLSFHGILSFTGLLMIFKVLVKYFNNKIPLLIFTSLLFFSLPFIYWTSTLSPYSYHLFCFGMILYNETYDLEISQKYLSKKSIRRAIIPLFNYQYIPIIIMLALFDLIQHKRNFFVLNKFKEWILASFVSVGTVLFLITRTFLTNKHATPNLSILQHIDGKKYEIWSNSSSLIDFIEYISSRIIDIITYFFQTTNYHLLLSENFISIDFFYSLIFVGLLILVFIVLFKNKSRLLKIVLIVLLTNFLLYLVGIYPFMPSRHSLVSFLPFIVVCTTLIYILLKRINNNYFSYTISFLFLITSIYNLQKSFKIQSVPINKEYLLSTLDHYSVDRLVLLPCDQEPLFIGNDIFKYKPLYQCGPMIIETLDEKSYRFGVYSKNIIDYDTVISSISKFFDNENANFKLVKQLNQISTINKKNVGNVNHTITIVDVKF